jgi:ribose 5-phosphate isomerase RpiB
MYDVGATSSPQHHTKYQKKAGRPFGGHTKRGKGVLVRFRRTKIPKSSKKLAGLLAATQKDARAFCATSSHQNSRIIKKADRPVGGHPEGCKGVLCDFVAPKFPNHQRRKRINQLPGAEKI